MWVFYPVLQLLDVRSLRHAPVSQLFRVAQQKQTDQTRPETVKSTCHRPGKVFLLALLFFPSSAAPLPQALPCLDRRRYWLRRDAPPHRIHSIASHRKLGTFAYGFRVRIRRRPDSLSLSAHPWSFFSLSMQPTRGEASSLPILPLLSFPLNLSPLTSLSLSFFSLLLFSLLHLTSPQLFNYLYYISSRLQLVTSFLLYLPHHLRRVH